MSRPQPELSIIICGKEDESELNKTLISLIDRITPRYKLELILSGFNHQYLKEVKFKLRNLNFDLCVSEPKGIYNAMNLGLNVSNTKYVLFLNSGDELYSIENLNTLLDKINERSWGYGRIVKIHNQQKISYSFNPYWSFLHRLGIKYVPHPAAVLNRELSLKLGGYDENYKVAADQKLLMQFGKNQAPVIVRTPISSFYKGGVSSLRTNSEIVKDFHSISIEVYGYIFNNIFIDRYVWKFLAKLRDLVI